MEIPSGCGFRAPPNVSCHSQPNTRLRGEFPGKPARAREIHGAQYCGALVEVKTATLPSIIHPSAPETSSRRVVPFHPSLELALDRRMDTQTEGKGQFVTLIHFGEEKSWEKFYFLISLHFGTTTMAANVVS